MQSKVTVVHSVLLLLRRHALPNDCWGRAGKLLNKHININFGVYLVLSKFLGISLS